MLGQDLKANLQTTNGGAGEHGKRNSHVSHVSVMSNTKEEVAMQSKIIFICPAMHDLFSQMMTRVWVCVAECCFGSLGVFSSLRCLFLCFKVRIS